MMDGWHWRCCTKDRGHRWRRGGRMDCVSVRITAEDSHTCHLTSAIKIWAKWLLTTGKGLGWQGLIYILVLKGSETISESGAESQTAYNWSITPFKHFAFDLTAHHPCEHWDLRGKITLIVKGVERTKEKRKMQTGRRMRLFQVNN